jgi:two-component system, response regulator, stage 0 sporulation protein F
MKTVLIVDDDRNLRRLYKAELEAEGYQTMLAENGWEATAMVARKMPDAVILDIRMPEMDGLEAMARILGENRKVPIILNTAYSCYQENFLAWAADGYLIKSADLQPLKTKLREILSPGREFEAAHSG